MAQHVFARVSGFGWTLLPLAPFRFERTSGPPHCIMATHFTGEGTRSATLRFGTGRPAVELAEGTPRLEDLLDLLPGPAGDRWSIETTVFAVPWPGAFAMHSCPSPPGFELLGPGGSMVYIQGPLLCSKLPAPESLAAAGQSVRRRGRSGPREWVELEYLHEGEPFRQTHRIVPFGDGHACLVTSQAPEGAATIADAAADEVAASLSPYPAEGP